MRPGKGPDDVEDDDEEEDDDDEKEATLWWVRLMRRSGRRWLRRNMMSSGTVMPHMASFCSDGQFVSSSRIPSTVRRLQNETSN
jgi:hypothetical protein